MLIRESTFLFVYTTILAALIGSVFGSFLNCAAWRIAHHESFITGRSHCPTCGHILSALDLIPIFSWLFLGGKCRYCKTKIPVRYPLTELFFMIMTVWCLWCSDLSILFVRNFVFGCCLFVLSLVDLEVYEIPDGCLILSVLVWILALPFSGADGGSTFELKGIVLHIIASIVIGGVILAISLLMDRLLKKDSLGGGDVKLFFVTGLYLGFVRSIFAVFLACIIGLVFIALRKNKTGDKYIPFGPSIAAAVWIMLLCGKPLADWYLGLIFG